MRASEVDRAARVIRDMIDVGRFLPGEAIWPAEVAARLGVERDVVAVALRELGLARITRGNAGPSGGYWVASRRHPRFRGLARASGRWLWSDKAGRTFVGSTRGGGVVAALADEEGHVVGHGLMVVTDDAARETLRAIRGGQPHAIEQAARKARQRAGAPWLGDVEVVPAPPLGPAVTWLNDTSRPGRWYLSWRDGSSAGELVIGSELTDAGPEIVLWRSVGGEPAGPASPVTGLGKMEMGLAAGVTAGAYRSLERLIGRLGTSNLLRLSRP